MLSEAELTQIIDDIKGSKKYRDMDMSAETVRDIILRELPNHKRKKEAIKAARRKLHKVMAPYLGDPDYDQAAQDLDTAFASGDKKQIKTTCADILAVHDSTRERLLLRGDFFQKIFAITGQPKRVLDIACGLNPLFFPWMDVEELEIFAYDIHKQRVDFLNHYIALQPGLTGRAIVQDILIDPPAESADVALLLKELRRLEERQRGCGLPLIQAAKARHVVVSLPAWNLTRRHDLRAIHRTLLFDMIAGQPWTVESMDFDNELVFVIDKAPSQDFRSIP